MLSRVLFVLVTIAIQASSGAGAAEGPPFPLAHIDYLPPSSFKTLPVAVRLRLEALGCSVPQPHREFSRMQPMNVIAGRFMSPALLDWAALCSRKGISSILVFTKEGETLYAELAEQPDDTYVQVVTPGESGFSRIIDTFPAKRLKPSAGGRDGIVDAYAEKASTIWVWNRARWAPRLGAD